ncbi:hypothetical protein V2A60_002431 [Cordyceps javanica]
MASDIHPGNQHLPAAGYESFQDDLQRVLAKEDASRRAILHLRHIVDLLADTQGTSPDIDPSSWKVLIDSLEQERSALRYFVGTGGDTGAGKSSLLNVLVNAKADIVPSSQNGACTAAVCCFSYPDVKSERKEFSAKIHMKSKATVEKELVDFFEDLHEFEDRSQNETGEDSVTFAERDRFDDQLNLIQGWSGLSEQRLRNLGRGGLAPEIVAECLHVQDIFDLSNPEEGLVISLSDDKESTFRAALKPFVGGRGAECLRWPLVEMVEIFVEADILQNGIVLVDLPGQMDALDARSRVARRFYSKLDRLIVVASGDRAANNKTAMDLIRDDQIVDMEAEGKLNTSNLGIVITKIDDMKWRSFIESEWPTSQVPAEIQHAVDRLGLLEELQAEVQDERGESGRLSPHMAIPDTDDFAFTSESSRHPLKLLQSEIRTLEAFCRRSCIDARSIDIKKQFQRRFEKIRTSLRSKTDFLLASPLEVFPVSSHKYRNIIAGKPSDTFPDAPSTGITALANWIVKGSLPKRESHADSIIQRCQVIFDAASSWATNDLCVDTVLSGVALSRLKDFLKEEKEILAENIMMESRKCAQELNSLCLAAQWSNPAKIDSLARGFVSHIDRYQKGTDGDKDKLHWSTYAACIRRNGGFFSTFRTPKREHYWQARTAMIMWMPHAVSWSHLFGKPVQDGAVTLQGRIRDVAESYSARIKASGLVPDEFKRAYCGYAYKIQNLAGEYAAALQQSVLRYREAGDRIRQETKDWCNEHMKGAYAAARKVTGSGKHAKQANIMHVHAEQLQSFIFHDIAERVDEKVRKVLLRLFRDIKECGDTLLSSIDKLTADLARRLSTPIANPVENGITPELERLKTAIANEAATWKTFWSTLQRQIPRNSPGAVVAVDAPVAIDKERAGVEVDMFMPSLSSPPSSCKDPQRASLSLIAQEPPSEDEAARFRRKGDEGGVSSLHNSTTTTVNGHRPVKRRCP